MSTTNAESITQALAAPFAPHEIKWKPQSVKNNRALALAYLDCRKVQDRLDEVLGVEHWQDEYEILNDGSVMCKLRIQIGEQWITKMDVGSPSEQPDGGDRMKAAFSDALKRAAVKFGIGRYLYRLPAQWADFDPVKKQFVQAPTLPVAARPTPPKPAPAPKPARLPANGEELHQRLRDYDAKLAAEKKCQVGMLLAHVSQAGVNQGYGPDLTTWTGPAIDFGVEVARKFGEKKPERSTAA